MIVTSLPEIVAASISIVAFLLPRPKGRSGLASEATRLAAKVTSPVAAMLAPSSTTILRSPVRKSATSTGRFDAMDSAASSPCANNSMSPAAISAVALTTISSAMIFSFALPRSIVPSIVTLSLNAPPSIVKESVGTGNVWVPMPPKPKSPVGTPETSMLEPTCLTTIVSPANALPNTDSSAASSCRASNCSKACTRLRFLRRARRSPLASFVFRRRRKSPSRESKFIAYPIPFGDLF